MKKRILAAVLCLMCITALGGCGDSKSDPDNSAEAGLPVEDTTNIAAENDGAEQAEQPEDTAGGSESEADDEAVLSGEDIEAAKKAAMDYYAGTVFEVNSMTYIEPGTNDLVEGECNFTVNVSKDGKVQEPDRMIQLNRNGDTWEVIGEGY